MIGRDGGDGTWVRRLTQSEDVEALVRLFEAIAREEGWLPGDALRAYRGRSVYFGARVGEMLAGGLQLVRGRGLDPLPHRAVWPELDMGDTDDTAEVLILALLPEHRGRYGLLWPLCVAMWRLCVGEGIETLLLEATPPTLSVYRRLGFPLEVVGGLREHWGEECFLCRMGVQEVADILAAKAARSRTYREILALACREDSPVLA